MPSYVPNVFVAGIFTSEPFLMLIDTYVNWLHGISHRHAMFSSVPIVGYFISILLVVLWLLFYVLSISLE